MNKKPSERIKEAYFPQEIKIEGYDNIISIPHLFGNNGIAIEIIGDILDDFDTRITHLEEKK